MIKKGIAFLALGHPISIDDEFASYAKVNLYIEIRSQTRLQECISSRGVNVTMHGLDAVIQKYLTFILTDIL